MTAYHAECSSSTSSTTYSISIKPNAWPIRIAQVNAWGINSIGNVFTAYRYDSGTVSGGSALDLVPLRQGAPAASATGLGGTLTFTGTKRSLGNVYLPPGEQSSVSGTTVINTFPGSSASISFPLTVVIAPGSVFRLGANFVDNNGVAEVVFEELRLSGSY